jgi:methanogenic corrinoid protein MtbC1
MIDPKQTKKVDAERAGLLIDLIAELKEAESLAELKKLHKEGYDPAQLLECCAQGVRRVGMRFEKGEYYISALIMAGEIMSQSSEYLKPHLTGHKDTEIIGRVVLGTIEGDIHDLGKNILKDQLKCNGFEVIDLGVDVPAETFAQKALELDPDFVCISCLLTTSHSFVHQAVKLLKKERALKKYKIVIGGTSIDAVLNEKIKADNWFTDAQQAVMFFRKWIEQEKPADKQA